MSYSSKINQSSSPSAEKKINKLVHVLLQTKYDYTAVLANMRSDDVAQDGVRKYFKRRIQDTQSDLQTLIKIQQQIGGLTQFPELRVPTKVQFESVLEVMQDALVKEKLINQILVELHSRLVQQVPQLQDIPETIEEMLQDRDQHIQQIVEHIVHLEQNQGSVGEFVISKLLKKEHTRIRKETLEMDQIKYKQSTKEQPLRSIYKKTTLSVAKRPWQKRFTQQEPSDKIFLTQNIKDSRFAKQFKTKNVLEQSSIPSY